MKLTTNKTKVIFILLAVLSAIFFGLASLLLMQIVGERYVYLLALPAAILFCSFFLLDRYMFFMVVVITRSSLDVVFTAIKFGSFGLGAVLNALVILIALLTYLEKPAKLDIDLSSVKTAWGVFLTLSLLSLFFAPVFLPGIKFFLLFVSYASMFYLGLSLVKSNEDFGKWIKVVIYSSIIPTVYGFYCLMFGGGGVRFSYQEGLRLQSTSLHPNSLAFYLVLIITISFYLFKTKPSYINARVLRLIPIYILLLLFMLVMTKTRAAWVACYLFFILYAVFHDRKFLIIVIGMSFLALLIPDVQERLLDLQKGNTYGGGYERLNSYAWRKQTWENALKWMSETHYIFGYGLSSFMHYSTDFVMANAFQKQKTEINAHSVYVQMFFELGILGVLSFFYLIFAHLKTLFDVYYRNKLLIFTVIVILIEFLFESYSDNMMDYLIYEWYLWFIVGISISGVSKHNKPKLIIG